MIFLPVAAIYRDTDRIEISDRDKALRTAGARAVLLSCEPSFRCRVPQS